MTATCPGCGQSVRENSRIELRGALAYHLDCAPSSAGAPRSVWEAFLCLFGCRR
jgi:hypothetical protein